VAHEVDVSKEADLLKFYRNEYRPAPTHQNLLTTTHKRMYIAKFLEDFLNERDPKKAGKQMICGDVGCATGYIPAWLRGIGHKATGCELTTQYRRFSEHFYGIPIPENLEKKHRYDLITIYHVLEHLMEPDKKLAQYRDLMDDDGRILVSTPEWFDVIEEPSNLPLNSFDALFHKNHINLFSAISLKNLFAKVGLEIVKEDHITYGQTYLLKKCEPTQLKVVEDWEKQVEKMEKIKAAITAHMKGQHEIAIETWRRFPEAWIAQAHGKEAKEPGRQADIFKRALEIMPDNMRLLMAYGTWLYMREDLKGALKVFEAIAQYKPNETLLIFTGYCHGKLGNFSGAAKCFYQATEINPTKWAECMDQLCAMAAIQPTWDEKALQALGNEAVKKAVEGGNAPVIDDPVMMEDEIKSASEKVEEKK
jgi:SAM-dependent methyltransferase